MENKEPTDLELFNFMLKRDGFTVITKDYLGKLYLCGFWTSSSETGRYFNDIGNSRVTKREAVKAAYLYMLNGGKLYNDF